MEFMAFKLCMDYLITFGLSITTFISDRHTSIAKYMRDVLKNIVHYFDIWHLKKSKNIPNLILYFAVHIKILYACNSMYTQKNINPISSWSLTQTHSQVKIGDRTINITGHLYHQCSKHICTFCVWQKLERFFPKLAKRKSVRQWMSGSGHVKTIYIGVLLPHSVAMGL